MSAQEASFRALREDLADERERIIESMTRGYDDDVVAKLAAYQGAIAGIDAHLAEPPVAKTGPKVRYGEDGYPVAD